MSPLTFLLFQIFGILPFKITRKQKVLYSKAWHSWATFLILSVIVLSIIRVILFWYFETFYNIGFIYKCLIRFEPYSILFGSILLGAPVLSSSLFKRLEKYAQAVVTTSTSATKKFANKATVAVLILMFAYNMMTYVVFKPMINDYTELLNFSIGVMQSVYGLINFLHCYLTLYTISYNLTIIEERLEGLRSKPNYYKVILRRGILKKIDDNILVYEYFSKIFYFFIKIITFDVFYESLLGIKHIEDLLCFIEKGGSIVLGITLFICHLQGVPLLFSVIHQGHSIQVKVTSKRACCIKYR